MKTDGILRSKFENINEEDSLNSSSVHSLKSAKADLSTFIEELEETTEKLMNEVFALPSLSEIKIKPDLTDESISRFELQSPQSPTKPTAKKQTKTPKALNHVASLPKKPSGPLLRMDFAARSKEQELARKARFQKLLEEEEQQLSRIYTYHPKTNKSTVEVRPIQQRTAQIVQQKERKLQQQRAQQKFAQDQQLKACTFAPEVNHRSNPRTPHRYYDDKVQWEQRRLDSIEKERQLTEIREAKQAVFQPDIFTEGSPFHRKNVERNRHTRVEDRLLQSLERSAQKLRRQRTQPF